METVWLLQRVFVLYSDEATLTERNQSGEHFQWIAEYTTLSKEQHKQPGPVEMWSSLRGPFRKISCSEDGLY